MLHNLILKDGSIYYITSEHYLRYKDYHWLNLNQEFIKMENWCIDHISQRKTLRGVNKFITGWLNRASKKSNSTRDIPLMQDLTDRSWAK